MNTTLFIKVTAVLAIAYVLVVVVFVILNTWQQGLINNYLSSKCELLSDHTGVHKWYECDKTTSGVADNQ